MRKNKHYFNDKISFALYGAKRAYKSKWVQLQLNPTKRMKRLIIANIQMQQTDAEFREEIVPQININIL